jgi:hypothetical protein
MLSLASLVPNEPRFENKNIQTMFLDKINMDLKEIIDLFNELDQNNNLCKALAHSIVNHPKVYMRDLIDLLKTGKNSDI